MVSYKTVLPLDQGIFLFQFLSKEVIKQKGKDIHSNITYFRKVEIEITL